MDCGSPTKMPDSPESPQVSRPIVMCSAAAPFASPNSPPDRRLRPASLYTCHSRHRPCRPIGYAERGIVIPMALITRVYLVDDLDGSEDDVSTVMFNLDGKDYEIDLSADNAERLR